MKKLVFGIVAILISTLSFAQTANDYLEVSRGVLKTEKKAIVAEVMVLTDTESAAFWPLYNEYNEKMYAVNTDFFNLVKDFSANYETMTDEKADEIWKGAITVESKLLKLKKQYYKKFSKVLPSTKAVRYFQTENKVKALVDAELALEIPLFEAAE